MFSFRTTSESGFTLVETLVAIAIFASSVTALISISGRGVNDNVFVKNKLIASYLAQEGVELVRNIRDTRALEIGTSDYWLSFLSNDSGIGDCYSTDGSDACMIDGSAQTIAALPCLNGVCDPLTYEEDENLYGYFFPEETIFTRTIQVLPVNGGTSEVRVRSTVTWNQGSRTFTTSYQYALFNWLY